MMFIHFEHNSSSSRSKSISLVGVAHTTRQLRHDNLVYKNNSILIAHMIEKGIFRVIIGANESCYKRGIDTCIIIAQRVCISAYKDF